MSDLDALERRVTEKWATAAASRIPADVFDPSGWLDGVDMSAWRRNLPPSAPQFPREQWVSYPNKRTVALLIADRLLDFDELSDEQWATLNVVMLYGGKTRIA